MRSIGVYILIFVLLCTHTTFGELLKTPFLGEHFIAHQKRDPAISVMQFLSMHYWGKDINDKDWKQDMKLPFKKILPHSHQLLFQTAVKTYTIEKNIYAVIAPLIYRETFIQQPCADQLYRPPQV